MDGYRYLQPDNAARRGRYCHGTMSYVSQPLTASNWPLRCGAIGSALGLQRIPAPSEGVGAGLCLGGTEGQRVGLGTLCAAPEGPPLAQRVDSVPANLPVAWHGGGGLVFTPLHVVVLKELKLDIYFDKEKEFRFSLHATPAPLSPQRARAPAAGHGPPSELPAAAN